MATAAQIVQGIKTHKLAPVYVLEGEEPYGINELMKYFETDVIAEDQRDWNLIVRYGAEVEYGEILNDARQHPMFGDRILILLRDAGQMKSLNELHGYLEQPTPTTTLVIEHKGSKINRTTKLGKALAKHSTLYTSEKTKEQDLPAWIMNYGTGLNINIAPAEAEILSMLLGADQQRISNELDKLLINAPDTKQLSQGLILKYIGNSREYSSMFEFIDALFLRQTTKLAHIINYYSANPKDAALPPMIALLYTFVTKAYLCHYIPGGDFKADKSNGIWAKHRSFSKKNSLNIIHRLIALLEEYSHKTVGIDYNGSDQLPLIKELVVKVNLLIA